MFHSFKTLLKETCKLYLLLLQPGECKKLEVYACPTSFGKKEETLIYNIRHNNTPGYIKVSYNFAKFIF